MLERELGRKLILANRAHFNLASRTFPKLGLGRGQVVALLEVGQRDGVTQSELAEQLEITPATLTNLLNRMEAAGFISRTRDQVDTRVSRVHLSETGKSVLAQVRAQADEIDRQAFAGFSQDEQEKLNEFFERIHANLTK